MSTRGPTQVYKKAISDRLSIFEQKTDSVSKESRAPITRKKSTFSRNFRDIQSAFNAGKMVDRKTSVDENVEDVDTPQERKVSSASEAASPTASAKTSINSMASTTPKSVQRVPKNQPSTVTTNASRKGVKVAPKVPPKPTPKANTGAPAPGKERVTPGVTDKTTKSAQAIETQPKQPQISKKAASTGVKSTTPTKTTTGAKVNGVAPKTAPKQTPAPLKSSLKKAPTKELPKQDSKQELKQSSVAPKPTPIIKKEQTPLTKKPSASKIEPTPEVESSRRKKESEVQNKILTKKPSFQVENAQKKSLDNGNKKISITSELSEDSGNLRGSKKTSLSTKKSSISSESPEGKKLSVSSKKSSVCSEEVSQTPSKKSSLSGKKISMCSENAESLQAEKKMSVSSKKNSISSDSSEISGTGAKKSSVTSKKNSVNLESSGIQTGVKKSSFSSKKSSVSSVVPETSAAKKISLTGKKSSITESAKMFEKKSSFSGSEKVLEKKSSTSELTFKKTSVSASASEKLMDRIKKFSNGGVDLDKAKKTSVTEVIDLKQGEIKEEEFSIFINDQQPKIIEEENLELNQELSSLQEEDATSLVDGRTEDQYLVTEPEVDIPVETGVEIENENHSERSDSFENILEIQDDGQQEFGLRAAMAGEEAAGRQGEVAEQAEWAEKANSSTSTTVALLIKRESTLYAFDNEQKYVAEASFDIVEAVEEDISDNYGQLEDAIVYQRQKLASQSSSYSVTSSNESLVERKLSTPVSDAKSDNFLSSSCKLDVPVVTVEEPDSAPVVFADEDEEHQSFSGYSTPRQISDTESTPTKLEEFDNSKFNFSEVAKSREDHSKIITDYHSRMSNLISEDEVSFLKKQNHDLEMKLKKEEDEIDDLVSQVQMLEQAKLKLEQSITNLKKEHKQECSQKDEEMEELRVNMQKKLKALEQQLESEHDERLAFVREKKEMESKINNLHELVSMRNNDDDDTIIRLRKDLKRTKALLKDAQSMATRPGNDSANKVVVRQLKNQLEDAEYAKIAAMKFRQNLELELTDVQQQLDDVIKAKAEVEDRSLRISREKADLSTHLDEMEEEMQEVMKKYKSSVAQLSLNQITIQDQANRVSELEEERKILKEQVAEMSQKIESLEGETVTDMQHSRLELKIKELESKVELEQTTRGRMETQINRLKEAIEKLNSENDHLRSKELSGQEQCRKLQRQVRDLKEELANIQQRETELHAKKHEMEKQLEISESESVLAKNDLKLALKRIDDLQAAISGEIDSESDSDDSDDSSSDGSEDMYFGSTQHRIIPKIRTTFIRDTFKARHLETMPEEPEYRL